MLLTHTFSFVFSPQNEQCTKVPQKTYIAIAGNIGTGKTTLTTMLSKRFGWEPHFEAVTENPYLEDFYADMHRWSFELQVYFLNHRFKAHQSVLQGTVSAIQDRSIYEDANIFARNLYEQGYMKDREYQNYLSLYHSMISFLTPPDLVLYLRKSLPRLKEQIHLRGFHYERNIPDEYLNNLNLYYDDWMKSYSLGPKLVLETDHLDFLNKEDDFHFVCQSIVATLSQRDLFLESQLKSK